MRKITLFFIVFILLFILSRTSVFAQENDHTAREETEGKAIWEKLQNKKTSCDKLSEQDFGALGEYFMGQSIGNTERHVAMNQMMSSMMGEEGEEQMHVVMGKRLSECDSSVQVPSQSVGFMPMMWMMGSAFAPGSFGGTKGVGSSYSWSYFLDSLSGSIRAR